MYEYCMNEYCMYEYCSSNWNISKFFKHSFSILNYSHVYLHYFIICLIDKLILIICEPVLYYARRLRKCEIHDTFIFTFLCCFCFCSFLYDIKYSYLILMIWKLISLTNCWNTSRYYHSRSEWIWVWWQWRGNSHSQDLQNLSLTIRYSLV